MLQYIQHLVDSTKQAFFVCAVTTVTIIKKRHRRLAPTAYRSTARSWSFPTKQPKQERLASLPSDYALQIHAGASAALRAAPDLPGQHKQQHALRPLRLWVCFTAR